MLQVPEPRRSRSPNRDSFVLGRSGLGGTDLGEAVTGGCHPCSVFYGRSPGGFSGTCMIPGQFFCVGRSHHGDSGIRSNADHGRGRSHGSNRHCHCPCHRRFRHHNLDEPAAHAIESTATPFTATSRRPLGLSASSSTSIFS